MPENKLTSQQIEEIKELKARTEAAGGKFIYSRIAKAYGVSGQTIRRNIAPNEKDLEPQSHNPLTAKEYEKNYVRRFHLKLNIKTDEAIIRKLDSLENKQGYIKKLILEDIETEHKVSD